MDQGKPLMNLPVFPSSNELEINEASGGSSAEGDSYMFEIAEILDQVEGKTESEEDKDQEVIIVSDSSHRSKTKASKHRKSLDICSPSSRLSSSQGFSKSPSFQSASNTNEIAYITQITSNDAIRSIYSLVSSKLPFSCSASTDFTERDKAEIQNYFQNKKCEFQDALEKEIQHRPYTPYESHKLEKAKKINNKRENKIEFISKKNQVEEIERIQNAKEVANYQFKQKIRHKIKEATLRAEKTQKIERQKKRKEIKVTHKQEKDLIIENIKNFYKDRIDLIKDKIDSEKNKKQRVDYEERVLLSQLKRENKEIKNKMLYDIKLSLEQEKRNIDRNLLELDKYEAKMLKKYKYVI
ncbi:unnamed protein product [Blepharisma stoltei]|uniref:Uncharacterized protein n=1 Tax=Blepharisma stoltei TaxID=1481888 RepID=A0AAU9JG52_9CILI|nr:unnamed protein product [Blepharisma stoltei]